MNDTILIKQLKQARTIAVVGLSPKKHRDSHRVALYLQRVNYRIIPVHPMAKEILGEPCYPNLDAIPKEIVVDLVNVFRRAEQTPPVAEAAVRLGGVRCLWLQQGIRNDTALSIARDAGLIPVQDLCIMLEHQRLFMNSFMNSNSAMGVDQK